MSACSRAERVGAEAAACGAGPGRWPPGRRRGGARREECRALPASAESPAPGLIMENPPVIFHPFLCWSVPPGPASAPPERDDSVFELFPAAPWPGPGRCGVAARCRCPQGSVRRRQGLFPCLPVGLPEAQRAGMPPARLAAWSAPLRRGARRDSLGRGQWDSEAPSGHHPPGVSLAQPFPAPRRPSLPLSLDGPPGPLVLGAEGPGCRAVGAAVEVGPCACCPCYWLGTAFVRWRCRRLGLSLQALGCSCDRDWQARVARIRQPWRLRVVL